MYDLLDLYAHPLQPGESVVCLDEKSKQLLKDSRAPLPMRPGTPVRLDYEYVRAGTCNLFVAAWSPRVASEPSKSPIAAPKPTS